MMPVDIDNFIFIAINCYGVENGIRIINQFNKIPREIGNCYYLKYMYLKNRGIEDISALSNCYSLQFLNLNNNQIKDISALSNCSSLKSLYLHNNKIVDMSVLSSCSSLEFLDIRYNESYKRYNFNSNINVYS